MKQFSQLILLAGLTVAAVNVPIARAQTVSPDEAATASDKRAIQDATDQLIVALKRGDVTGAMQWLAPDFRLGNHQYRVRDLKWMKRVLPQQLARGRYVALSIRVTDVELRDGIATTDERVNADIETKKGVPTASGLEKWSTEGAGHSEWVLTARGWRLHKANSTLEALLYLAAPAAPLTSQSAANADETAATVGLPIEEPVAVIERVNGQFERALAWTPDGTALAFNPDYRADIIEFAATQTDETLRKIPGAAFFLAIPKQQNGNLWTAGRRQSPPPQQRRWRGLESVGRGARK